MANTGQGCRDHHNINGRGDYLLHFLEVETNSHVPDKLKNYNIHYSDSLQFKLLQK